MGLKDFDNSKIKSWRYDDIGTKQKSQEFMDGHSGTRVDGTRDLILEKFLDSPKESKPDASSYDLESNPPSPQSFEANGYTVTGKRDKINEMFLDSKLESNAYASDYDPIYNNIPQSFDANGYTVTGIRDIISGKFVNDSKTLLIGDNTIFEPNVTDTPLNPLTQQQNYTVTNPAGEHTITGLKGSKISDWDLQKGLSLILTNWSDMVDAKTLTSYKIARVGKNATHGHLEIPYSYHNFGSTAVDTEPFSYGSLSPNIGWTVELERGGNAVDGIVKDYKKILESGGMWKRFVQKQSDMQVMGTITVGSVMGGLFEAPFDTFNSLDYVVALGSTAQPYRLGSIMAGVPRYGEHTPVISDQWYDDISAWHPDGDSIGADDNFAKESKMLYLYENFILNDPPDPPSGWADIGVAFATSYWASITNPYPIVPSINIVKAPGYGTTQGQTLAWTDKNLLYGGTTSEGNQRKYSTKDEKGSTVMTPGWDKYDFFSKKGLPHKPTEERMEESKLEIIDNDDWFAPEGFPSLRQKMLGNTDATQQTPLIPKSVQHSLDGENTLEKFSKDTRGLVNKYSTLGYRHLGLEADVGKPNADGTTTPDYQDITYENTLHSPSEIIAELIDTPFPEFSDTVKRKNGSFEAESGIRKEGQNKVYAIGKQGMNVTTNENQVAPLKPVHKYGFRGRINEDSNDSLFGDHVDQVNALPYGESDPNLDFVPLIFHDVYNKKNIQFRALFTEDIADTISPSWNPINYIGRTTAVYTYQNTARSLSFGFTIFPKTKQEFPILLEKVNYLVGMCYPNLDDYFRASGPLIKLTAGDIVKEQLGFLSECSVTFPSSESPWETDKGLQFTKKIDISIGFTYIGNNIPVAKGVHYNLDWLDGEHYTGAGVAWKDGPARTVGESKLDMKAIIDVAPVVSK